jgi:hypothetical protein
LRIAFVVILFILVEVFWAGYQRFGEPCCSHLQVEDWGSTVSAQKTSTRTFTAVKTSNLPCLSVFLSFLWGGKKKAELCLGKAPSFV